MCQFMELLGAMDVQISMMAGTGKKARQPLISRTHTKTNKLQFSADHQTLDFEY